MKEGTIVIVQRCRGSISCLALVATTLVIAPARGLTQDSPAKKPPYSLNALIELIRSGVKSNQIRNLVNKHCLAFLVDASAQ